MKKKIVIIAAITFIGLALVVFTYYQNIFGKAIKKETVLFVNETDNLIDLNKKIAPISNRPNYFLWLASKKSFTKVKSGRYILSKGMSNNDLVNMLRIGNQTAVSVSFNNQDTLEKFAGRIAEQIAKDSIAILNSFKNEQFLKENSLTEKSVLQICIPNSYEFYWTVSADQFRDKLLTEYNRFWNKNRLTKAKDLNMTQSEVITLASIVQKETTKKIERPIVAGLYINRLKNSWPLQADPTVIYAIKEVKGKDFVVKRVLNVDLEINSPYNTYKNTGLPPTLISMPDISSIDAVLNYKKHNYYYMCVDIENFGYHKFANSLTQHNRNARKYQAWLNKNGVNR
ncbi:endolytic transglycosylase MltG [Polaribacter sp.]|uniref:endolytic transglycosylase MltG n=1 Tax=Polaribacter sp. TaxID=1920175 RepID=UPI0025F5822E|nr:endolytic transglycosylase MltG [Polaribacter sp.]